jgi:hypothetical protein
MWQANPTWGSPRIQAELAKLGIQISDSTIHKYRPEHRRSTSAQTWKTFLHNHAKELVAVDLFTVPTATFRVLYVFVVLAHERRKVLHFHITPAPSAAWAAQQMVEAFPFTTPPHYLLRDRDGCRWQKYYRMWQGKRDGSSVRELSSPVMGDSLAWEPSRSSPAAASQRGPHRRSSPRYSIREWQQS